MRISWIYTYVCMHIYNVYIYSGVSDRLLLQRLHRWSLGMDKLFHPICYDRCDYVSRVRWKLMILNKSVPWVSSLALEQSHDCPSQWGKLRNILKNHTNPLKKCIVSTKQNTAKRWDISWIMFHYNDVIMDVIASQITNLTIVYSTVYSDAD